MVENIHNILITLTEMGVGRLDGPACGATMARLKERYPGYLAVSISNLDKVVWCSTSPSAVGISVADRPYRGDALRSGGIVTGPAILARTTGRPTIPFALAYPGPDGAPAGVATVLLDIGWLEQYLAQKSLPDHAAVVIADNGGVILAAVPAAPMTPGQRLPDELLPLLAADDEGLVERSGGDGVLRVIAYSPPAVKLRGLYFQVSLDKDVAMRSVNLAALRSLLIFCGLSLVAGVGAAWGLRWFLRVREQAQRNALKTASVLASTVDGVVEIDRDWRFTYLNDKARALSPGGRDLFGTTVWDAFPEMAGGPLWERMHQAMAGRSQLDVEFQGARSGRWYWMRAFPSDNGMTLYLLDITRRRKAEEDLRASNERLSLALESAQAGTFDWDLRAGRGHWSEGSYRIFGLDPATDAVDSGTWKRVVHPEDRGFASVTEGGALGTTPERPGFNLEYRILRPDGRLRWVLSIGRMRYDDGGAPVQFSGINIDITQRKAMEEALRRSEERLNIALSAADAALWDIDLISGAVNWSENNYRLFGLDPAAVTPNQEALLERVLPADREMVRTHIRQVLEGAPDHGVEYRVLHPRDGTRWIMSIGRVERDRAGRPVHFSALNIDLTARKAMEESLRDAKEKADEANISKSRFLAAASHDLRQPLQSALLFAGALHPHVDAARGHGPLTSLERALDTLKNLLDSLLDVSRLDAGVIAPRIADVPLGPLLEEIAAAYAPIAASKGLAFGIETPGADAPTVRSDALLLGRMLRNLVENAIRYTDQGHVRIRCETVAGGVCIKVEDSGIGISPEHLTKVFEEFHQVGNPERDRSQGLGLGLAIVQRLSRLLNHPVLVRSEPGRGSVFSVEVPRAALAAAPAPAPAAEAEKTEAAKAAGGGNGRLAVVIDDDVIVLTGLRTIFEEWSYDVVMAGSTDQALERLQSVTHPPDIIVADYRLRNQRVGTEAVVKIRERAGRPVPGIILTGEIGTECEREAAALGLAVVHKPITPRQLHGIVQRLMASGA